MVAGSGGMALLNTHPDYMNFDGGVRQRSEDGRQPATQTADKRAGDSKGENGRRTRDEGRRTRAKGRGQGAGGRRTREDGRRLGKR